MEVLISGGEIPHLLPYCEMLFIYYTIKCGELLSDRHSYVEDKIDESDLRKRKILKIGHRICGRNANES